MARYAALWLTIVIFGGSASLLKSTGVVSTQFNQLEVSIGGALVLHSIIATILGFITAAWAAHIHSVTTRYALRVAPFILVSIDELSQQFLNTRNYSWLDFLVNNACLLLGLVGYHVVCKLRGAPLSANKTH